MKKRILTSLMGLGIILNAGAQISEGGIPTSFRKTLVDETSIFDQSYHVHTLAAPDMQVVRQEDAENDVKGKPYRVGINIPVSYNMYNSGTWLALENGDKIWRMGIRIPDATGLSLYFSEPVQIPAGGKLHAYNAKHSQYVGAYTSNTPTFQAMEIIQGDFITLEYLMPAGSFDLPVIEISEIAYYYRGFEARLASYKEANEITQERAHGSCEVDAVCSESTGHVDQRSSAVHYSFVAGGTYVCSGAVINNTANYCTPYILTANHCGETDATSYITNHVWYFYFQSPSCTPGNTSTYPGALSQTMSGGIFRASSSLGTHPAATGSQLDGADFALIELSSNIPAGYNPYFSGWSRSTTAATSGVCYHHPSGDEKKISTYSSSLSSATYNGGWANAHWEVQWVATANGHGVTEGGSSGSPIYDQNNRIVGHLSGGSSYCTTPDQTDLYGKFNQAWSNDGSGNSSRLQPWLDPGSTGSMTLDGTFAPCAPVAPTA
ncbi:MAG: trypsin-like peptidase domain-containing protein, partial [Crocinitomicaceae bacterium]|nr:trypsin-like peptidase domain-containing protein [Crocinitomicaceae bacterium]